MNNSDFRALLSGEESHQNGRKAGAVPVEPAQARAKAFTSFAPRSVRNAHVRHDFGAKKDAAKETKTSAKNAPKGLKLAEGYVDRAKLRAEADKEDDDERVRKIRRLQEQLKAGELSQADFQKRVDETLDGDISSTHLVKGLDRKLLDRVRRGEDVFSGKPKTTDPQSPNDEALPEVDEDAELDALAERQIDTIQRVQQKQGQVAAPAPVAGKKRTRDDLIQEMKARRDAAAAAKKAAQPSLGSRFKKLGEKNAGLAPGSSIEIDEKGREVLITVDASGNVKRKVRKTAKPASEAKDESQSTRTEPHYNDVPLGMDVLEQFKNIPPQDANDDDDDDDIFAGVGDDYDPLADINQGQSSEDEADDSKEPQDPPTAREDAENGEITTESSTRMETVASKPRRKIFDDEDNDNSKTTFDPMQDPTILAALRRAKADQDKQATEGTEEERRQSELQKRLLARQDRDMDDLDMGFGSSRMDDEDDGQRIKLSEWDDGADDDDGEGGDKKRGGQGQRKRGKKKRKGDKNSASDVLRVMQSRQ